MVEIVNFIATTLDNSIREIEGVFRINASASFIIKIPLLNGSGSGSKEQIKETKREYKLPDIINIICKSIKY